MVCARRSESTRSVYLRCMNAAAPEIRYINRELSWLAFNHRVLQEAERTTIPAERVRFLGIFSNNMGEPRAGGQSATCVAGR